MSIKLPYKIKDKKNLHKVCLSYVREHDTMFVYIKDRKTGQLLSHNKAPVGFRAPYFAGFMCLASPKSLRDEYWAYVTIDKIILKSPDLRTRLRKFRPESVSDYFLLAGGEFIKGNYKPALKNYRKCLSLIKQNRWTHKDKRILGKEKEEIRLEAYFYRAFLYKRLGREKRALKEMFYVFDSAGDMPLKWFKENFKSMMENDRDFFKHAFWQYFSFLLNNLKPSLTGKPPELSPLQVHKLRKWASHILTPRQTRAQAGNEVLKFLFEK
jgi:tetratricopeptide (TPR) repeat protein